MSAADTWRGIFKASLNVPGFVVFVFVATGRRGGPAEPCRRPALRPGSAPGPAAQPLSVLWKAGRQVGELPPLFFLLARPRHVSDCDRLASFPRLPLGNLSNINIDTNTLEFQVHRNRVSVATPSLGGNQLSAVSSQRCAA